MAVDNPDTIDKIGITPENKVALIIDDHLGWSDENEHLMLLENKISSYLEAIDTNEIYQIYPQANEREIVIQVYFKHSPNEAGIFFLNEVNSFLVSKNIGFTYLIEN